MLEVDELDSILSISYSDQICDTGIWLTTNSDNQP